MKQVVQSISGGRVRVEEAPRPVIGANEVLVQTMASLISAGTERAVTQLAQSSLLTKAKARPDLVRQVINKARTEGLARTAHTVRSRLAEDLPLGYSGVGIAVKVGDAVAGISPGQLVATGGASMANHAEWQAVTGLLCAPVPSGVEPEHASFATVASIALHGLRLTEVTPGSSVAVVGLGLVGQLAARLALASGCRVVGLDVSPFPIERAAAAGALALQDSGATTSAEVLEWSRGLGVDAVIVAAADKSSGVIQRAPALCRDRANVVVIGDVGLELERTPFYDKELTLRVARSYGPGRYDRSYEEWGIDYPVGYVRWTEGRNQQTVLDLLASGRLDVSDLITHRFPIASATDAYELIESRSEPYLGIVLTYPTEAAPDSPIVVRPSARSTGDGIGLIGAGAFATAVLVPAFKEAGFSRCAAVASSSGLSAKRLAERAGFERAVSGGDAVISDPGVDVVVVATPHNTHASLVVAALEAGKHVWSEKPLALSADELDEVSRAWSSSGRVLFVGFNRRYSPAIDAAHASLRGTGPLVIDYRVSAGTVPPEHWYADRTQGGRLLGEVCHFIDTCAALAGPITRVSAMASGDRAELLLSESFSVSLGHEDGSLSTISYAAGGHLSTEKERIEVLGRGHTVVVRDFRELVVDGTAKKLGAQDKGHVAMVRAFREAVRRGEPMEVGLASSRAALDAAASLSR